MLLDFIHTQPGSTIEVTTLASKLHLHQQDRPGKHDMDIPDGMMPRRLDGSHTVHEIREHCCLCTS
jgi:hypothetical protein